MISPTMRSNGLSYRIDGKLVLELPEFTLPQSGVTALVGQNGSGKSTLLRILAHQQETTTGSVMLDERPLEAWGDREFARCIAYLPQHTPLAAGLRVHELVAMGRYPWHGALGRFTDADETKVQEALELTDTSGLADRMVDSLSGGERQRVWLAMLLAQDTRVMLLDEPLSALDPGHQVGVLSLIRKISSERELAVLIVLHDVNLAARFCDRIIALKDGRIAAEGEPDTFMTPERLSAVYDVPMGVIKAPDTDSSIAFVRRQ